MHKKPITLGVHSMCFTSDFTQADIPLLEKVQKWGARHFEIVPFNEDLSTFPVDEIRHAASDLGMTLSFGYGLPKGADPTSPIKSERRHAFDVSCRIIELAHRCNATGLYGAIHSVWGKLEPRSDEAWMRAVESMREVAEFAWNMDPAFRIGVENINRHETSLLNTIEEVVIFVKAVGMDNVGVHADLYHMHQEENSMIDALWKVEDKLIYLHANESHRGQPGTGQIDWPNVASTLNDIGYEGVAVLESFNPEDRKVSGPTRTWRRFAKSQDDLVRDGLSFLRDEFSHAGYDVL